LQLGPQQNLNTTPYCIREMAEKELQIEDASLEKDLLLQAIPVS
jgi:hypothetical protein